MPGPPAMLDIARSQLGVSENPPYSNQVLYSDWYGMVGPWCDMFVSWCAAQSGNAEAVGRFAYTPSHEAWFRSHGREVPIRDAQPGDIVFFNFIGRTSHVGIVEANHGDGLITIEGNTNGSGSRDGGSVIRHFRSWSSGIVSVHRPEYQGDDELAGEAETNILNAIFVLHIKQVQEHERTRGMIRRKFLRVFKSQAGEERKLAEIKAAVEQRLVPTARNLGISPERAQALIDAEFSALDFD